MGLDGPRSVLHVLLLDVDFWLFHGFVSTLRILAMAMVAFFFVGAGRPVGDGRR
jgi:hypothetical protein